MKQKIFTPFFDTFIAPPCAILEFAGIPVRLPFYGVKSGFIRMKPLILHINIMKLKKMEESL